MSVADTKTLTSSTVTHAHARETNSNKPEWKIALEEIAAKHGFTLEKLKEKCRFPQHVEARRECYRYLHARKWSLCQIGREFGGRDHTTIRFALDGEAEKIAMIARKNRKRDELRLIKAAGVK